ncbi:MAG TPA: hypothetical protein VF543_05465 [Pyrinomonadaceae bacterium]
MSELNIYDVYKYLAENPPITFASTFTIALMGAGLLNSFKRNIIGARFSLAIKQTLTLSGACSILATTAVVLTIGLTVLSRYLEGLAPRTVERVEWSPISVEPESLRPGKPDSVSPRSGREKTESGSRPKSVASPEAQPIPIEVQQNKEKSSPKANGNFAETSPGQSACHDKPSKH